MISTPTPPPPQAPPPPPNPPMYGSQATGSAAQAIARKNPATGGFAGTILGQGNPANTGQKTLLGQ